MDSLVHVSAEDEVAKLPVSTKEERKNGSNEFKNTSKQMVESLKEFSKANERCTQMTPASQSSSAEFAQTRTSFVVKRKKELMYIVRSMYCERGLSWSSKQWSVLSQKCDGKEYEETVSFVEIFEAMDACV